MMGIKMETIIANFYDKVCFRCRSFQTCKRCSDDIVKCATLIIWDKLERKE